MESLVVAGAVMSMTLMKMPRVGEEATEGGGDLRREHRGEDRRRKLRVGERLRECQELENVGEKAEGWRSPERRGIRDDQGGAKDGIGSGDRSCCSSDTKIDVEHARKERIVA